MKRFVTFLFTVLALVGINLQRPPLMAQGSVAVENISVSPFGSSPGYISGKVTGINPATVRVTILDFISGLGFFTKPFCAQTTTPLNADGTFTILTTTGGVDQTTTLYAVVVVAASATVPCYTSQPGV